MHFSNNIVISAKNLSKVYRLYNTPTDRLKEALHPGRRKFHRDFYALRDINLEIKRGEIIGIVGKNGSGKSTLLKIISRVLTPTSGEIEVKGKISSLLELGSGFNPELTGIENIFFYGTILGFSEAKIKSKLDEMISFADIGEFIHQPLKTYSSGMRARLAFSVAINVDPDILILDEVLAVGDELFRRKCYAKMETFFKGGKTILLVSHSASDINQLCNRAVLLDAGSMLLEGNSRMVTMYYQKMLYTNKSDVKSVLNEIQELQKDEKRKQLFLEENIKQKNELIVSDNTVPPMPDQAEFNRPDKPKTTLKSKLKPYFVKGFVPKSTVFIKSFDVELSEFQLFTPHGELVNHIVRGEYYVYKYKVRFNETLSNINFGMGIKSEKGVPISWILYPTSENLYLDQTFEKGTEIIVTVQFQCQLLPGNYYFDSGIRLQKDNAKVVGAKVRDCYAIKVLKDEFNIGGFVYLSQEMSFAEL